MLQKSLTRYTTLDAMRGLAAVAVVMRHFGQQFHQWQPALSHVSVDLFFALSGFVLSANYDAKLASDLSMVKFMRLRIIRLFPLALLGAIIGIISTWFVNQPARMTIPQAIGALLSALAVPWPWTGSNLLFPANPPFWTLFLELWVANLAFTLLWRSIRGWIIWLVIVLSALALIVCERQFHDMDIGWKWSQLDGGLARVFFSFFAGVAINRFQAIHPARVNIPTPLLLLLLVAVLFAPLPGKFLQLGSLFSVLVVMPCLIYFASNATDPHVKFSAFMGDCSYAVYTMHVPLIALLAWLLRNCGLLKLEGTQFWSLEIGFIAFVVVLASLADFYWDRPARKFLNRLKF